MVSARTLLLLLCLSGMSANTGPTVSTVCSQLYHTDLCLACAVTAAYYTCVFHHIAITNRNILWVCAVHASVLL